MEETRTVKVVESRDWNYVARLANCPEGGLKTGLRLFKVWIDDADGGAFVLLPKPDGWELHTELKTTGPLAMAAFRMLTRLLGTEGITKLLSYAERTNRKTLMGAAAGFPISVTFTGDESLSGRPMGRASTQSRPGVDKGVSEGAAPGCVIQTRKSSSSSLRYSYEASTAPPPRSRRLTMTQS